MKEIVSSIHEIVEKISVERKKRLDNAILGEIRQIAKDNSLDTVIVLDETAIVQALKKQIPKKPIIEYGKKPITHSYGRLMNFFCPICGRFLTAMYENDVENGGGIHRNWKGCPTCLQAIDFTGYYHIGKLDDEIELE